MNKQPSFFIKKWKYIQWMYIFCCYQQSHLWVEKNNLNKCFVFPSRNLFMLLVYLHPAHIDVQCYRVGFQLVYLIQWQVRIMTGRRKKRCTSIMAEFIAISILDFVQNIWYRHGQFEVLSPTVERANSSVCSSEYKTRTYNPNFVRT